MSEQPEIDPVTLAAAIERGDSQAEARLAAHFLPTLTYILKARFNDRDFAEDVAQETLISVIGNLRKGRLKNAESLSGYIHSIAMNHANQQLRDQYRRGPSADPAWAESVAAEDDVLDNLEDHQLASLVREALNDLPTPRDRELIRRYYLKDADKSQLCEDFDVSPEHFDRVAHRARARLKKLVKRKVRGRLIAMSLVALFNPLRIGQ